MSENTKHSRKKYPRPHFVREHWLNLNGDWDFSFDDSNVGEKEKWYRQTELTNKITVPFTYETKASGIGDTSYHRYIWYKRNIKLDKDLIEKKVILWF